MAGTQLAFLDTIPGSKAVFYMQADGSVLVSFYDSPGSPCLQIVISSANWTSLKAALSGADTTYTPATELGYPGAAHVVSS